MKSQFSWIFYFLIFSLLMSFTSAVPSRPVVHNFQQPDGTSFEGYLRGDENNAWYETKERYIIRKQDDWWIYDSLDRINSRFSVSQFNFDENRKVGQVNPSSVKALTAENLLEYEMDSKKILTDNTNAPRSSSSEEVSKKGSPRLSSPTTGTQKALVILINFTDKSQDPTHTADYFKNMLFNASNPLSMTNYFYETSYGQLNFTGEVAGNKWYNSSHNLAYYGSDCVDIDDCNVDISELAREAVLLADPEVNFANYDLNNDGYVDYLIIIHAGYGQEESYAVNDIWSHSWEVYPEQIVDGKKVYDYTMDPEFGQVGVFAHETAHDLGLPDLYKTTDPTSNIVGKWDLMDYGSWAGPGDDGTVPTHMSAWCKIKLGWLTPIEVKETPRSYYIKNIENNSEAYIVNDSNLNSEIEYFIVENRKAQGFDTYIPEEGILIWHIDNGIINYYTGSNQINSNSIKGVIPEYTSSINDAAFSSNDGKQYFNSTTTPNSSTNLGYVTTASVFVESAESASMLVHFFGGNVSSLTPSISVNNINSNAFIGSSNLPKNITITVLDPANEGIDNVSFYQNGNYLGVATLNSSLLYWYGWNPEEGAYNLTFSACKLNICENLTKSNITVDLSAPIFLNNTASNFIRRYESFMTNITLLDNYGLSYGGVESNHTGTMINYSYALSGVEANLSRSFNVTTSEENFSFRWWVNDSAGNLNYSAWTLANLINRPPTNLSIPNLNWTINSNKIVNLSNYFSDGDGDLLVYSNTSVQNISIIIDQNTGLATFIPETNFYGYRDIQFIANDAVNETYSNNVTLYIFRPSINASIFNGLTTNFSNISSFIGLNITFENDTSGRINFTNVNLTLENLDFDRNINISYNFAYLNSSALSILNTSATLTLYNITFSFPIIYKDGQICQQQYCNKLSHINNTFIFNVSSFSNYTTRESFCGDTVCTTLAGETCSTCSSDCGTCASSGGGGGGGGGGGSTPVKLSESQLSQGYSKNYFTGDKILFVSGGQNHSVQLNKILNNSVNVTIRSEPINLILQKGEEKKINFSSSEYYDLYIKVENVTKNTANITIRSIAELINPLVNYDNTKDNNDSRKGKQYEIFEDTKPQNTNILSIYALVILLFISAIYFLFKRIFSNKDKDTKNKKK